MTLAIKIKNFRLNMMLGQKEFAELLDISINTVSNWERGIGTPHLSSIKKMIQMARDNKIRLSMEDFNIQEL